MKLQFYQYVHCPFCIRVRMTLGYLRLPYESIVVPYDDEKTPIALTGKKMLPAMVIDGKAMNESLDIMAAIDSKNALKVLEVQKQADFLPFNEVLSKLGANVHNLAMPYWIYTPEFNETSRAYFQKKKETKRGPFKDLVKNQSQFKEELNKDLKIVTQDLKPFYRSDVFTVYDIMLAAHIWGLYVVPEFQFEDKLHKYLQNVKEICQFNYHEDFWR